ncbi:MAG: hypothetical protein KGL39_11510 [Patescibacteria group bacterium]|nr:hypothetical protein [Patescibacteria group bacterium]
MSWSVGAIGKAPAVAARIESEFSRYGACSDPEEGVKQSARKTLAVALAAQSPDTVVKVSAAGSQSVDHLTGATRNSLSIDVQWFYDFVE